MIHWGTFLQNGRKIKVFHTRYNGGRNKAFGHEEWCVIVFDREGNPAEEFFFPFVSGSAAPLRDDVSDLWAKVLELFKKSSPSSFSPRAAIGENPGRAM